MSTADLSSIIPSTDLTGVPCWIVCGVLTVYSYGLAVELVTDHRETPIAAPATLTLGTADLVPSEVRSIFPDYYRMLSLSKHFMQTFGLAA